MKNNEKKENKNLDLAKRFELDENAMNQIVGGTTFYMETMPGTSVTVSGPDDILCGDLEAVQVCEQGCKSCITIKIGFNICGTKLKGK